MISVSLSIVKQCCYIFVVASSVIVCSASETTLSNPYEHLIWNTGKSQQQGQTEGEPISNNIIPDGVFDVVTKPTASAVEGNNDIIIPEKYLCNFAVFLPYSRVRGGERSPYPSNSYRQAAPAIHLAVKHLNEGNGSVISDVEGLNERCNIGFVPTFYDTEASQSAAVRKVVDLLANDDNDNDNQGQNKPCYILGAALSSNSVAMATITSHLGTVQLSPISSTPILDDNSNYPLFGRLRPSSVFGAYKTVQYYCNVLKSTHLGVIHANNALGNEFRSAMLDAAEMICPKLIIVTADISSTHHDPQDEIDRAIHIMKETQFQHFFAVIDRSVPYDMLMETACNHTIAGTGEHLWMFSTGLGSLITRLKVEPGSCLHRATIGTGMISPHGGMPGQMEYDKFIEQWENLNNPDDIRFVQDRLPSIYPNEPDYVPGQINDGTFKSIAAPPLYAYDEVIAMGIAACSLLNKKLENKDAGQASSTLNGDSLFKKYLNTSFDGVTGHIKVDESTGSRDADSAYYVVFNYRQVLNKDEDGNTVVTFTRTITNLLSQDGAWHSITPYIFGDNTTNLPPSLPENTTHFNYIGTTVRVVGLIMFGLVTFCSVGFALWTISNRQTKVVQASQPSFLYIICAGTLLMGSTIIPLTIDDQVISQSGCNVTCVASPWLFQFGFNLVFAALFSKTNRVNRLFRNPDMRRRKISISDVIMPLCTILALNMIVLSTWTALRPVQFERIIVEVDRFDRPTESLGKCSYDNGSLPFMICLVVIDLGSLIVAMWEAYVARDISTEFAESLYIANAMSSVFLVLVVGIPVIALTGEEPRARVYTLSGIIFVICIALILFIFVPKVHYTITKTDDDVVQAMKRQIQSSVVEKSKRSDFNRNNNESNEYNQSYLMSSATNYQQEQQQKQPPYNNDDMEAKSQDVSSSRMMNKLSSSAAAADSVFSEEILSLSTTRSSSITNNISQTPQNKPDGENVVDV